MKRWIARHLILVVVIVGAVLLPASAASAHWSTWHTRPGTDPGGHLWYHDTYARGGPGFTVPQYARTAGNYHYHPVNGANDCHYYKSDPGPAPWYTGCFWHEGVYGHDMDNGGPGYEHFCWLFHDSSNNYQGVLYGSPPACWGD